MDRSRQISFTRLVDALDAELAAVRSTVESITDEQWANRSPLEPVGEDLPHWTLLQLVKHIDISIGLTLQLVDSEDHGPIEKDRVSFFLFDRSQAAPVVYDYAITESEGKSPDQITSELFETLDRSLEAARTGDPQTTGDGYFGRMTLKDFVATRIVEAVVHGMDVTDALERQPDATGDATAICAVILDDLVARRQVGGRPEGLEDDLDWIRAAAGRGPHPDGRLPVLG